MLLKFVERVSRANLKPKIEVMRRTENSMEEEEKADDKREQPLYEFTYLACA